MPAALIFDFDGIILDTEQAEFAAWTRVYREHGTALAFDEWVVCVGTLGAFDPVAHLAGLLGRPVDAAAVKERKRVLNDALLRDLPVLPGVRERLAEAKAAGVPCAIASSSTADWVEPLLAARGLRGSFAVVSVRGGMLRAKPEPDTYLAALAALGIPAGRAVALEDSMNGVAAAKAAGLYCVAVPNPVTAGMDLSRADRRIGSLLETDLHDLDQSLNQGRVPA